MARRGQRLGPLAWGGGALLLGAWGAASPAVAQGASGCSVGALTGIVPGATIVSATSVAAASPTPAYCDVIGTLDTSETGEPVGSAGFELRLPDDWNGKFLFFGVGGLAGGTYGDFAANPTDLAEALPKGFATAITDAGHLAGGTDASWALVAFGKPDQAKVADYYYRATHEVTVAGKQIVAAYYGSPIGQSYFDGCSNGGRQAMVEAALYPEDYDGIIAGAPFQDIRSILGGLKDAKALFATPSSYLPASLLPAIDAAVYAACDALDGVTDGLIQNPAACTFKPSDLVCAAGQTGNCLTQDQANFLTTYISPVRDEPGNLIYPGFSITDLSNGGLDAWTVGTTPPTAPGTAEPWGNNGFAPAPYGFQFVDHIVKYLVTHVPTYDIFNYPIGLDGVVTPEALAMFDARTKPGSAAAPEDFQAFISQGRKLLWYHGYSDPALPPFRSVLLYEQLAAQAQGSYAGLQDNIRLFMVPDMQHCGGGPGPNVFDTLSALDAWVTQDQAPDAIVAAHYQGNDPTKPVTRTMPLCAFPAQAVYDGSGDVNQASSWSCAPNSRLLDVGPDGAQAGLTPSGG
ncbi:MAG: tannase/feruloyl esterase family alpha/beta hydrolase [Acetobacteraceae bacterium]|nr:tannase/feruloyl esterase family alpha/beta hydrolase [Acetobacteraceae bacterium]